MSGGKNYRLADFLPLIERLTASGADYALIGGLAVALLGEKYIPQDRKVRFRLPIYSKDLDFQGDRELKTRITAEIAALGWQSRSGGTRLPKPELRRSISHWILVEINGKPTSIEVLEGLPVEEMEFAEEIIGTWVTVDGIVVLDPCTLLVAKLAALHGRPQGEENNDAPHCEILVEVIPAFLREIEALRVERRVEYDPLADAWRLLLVLERGKFPLPLAELAAGDFEKWLRQFTVTWLMREGKIAAEEETRVVAEDLLRAHGIRGTAIADVRVLYTVAGWYRAVLYACKGAPSHATLIDASGRPLAQPDADRALTYDRLAGGILHALNYLGPVQSDADPSEVAHARATYLRWLIEECGTMQLDGLPADADLSVKRMRLEQLFVPLRLMVDEYPAEGTTAMTIDEVEKLWRKWPTVKAFGAALVTYRRLAILAAPGGGKSTVLKRLASAYADPERMANVADDLPRRSWLPLFVRCRELRERAVLPMIDLLEDLGRHAGADAAAFRIHLRDTLRSGDALLLVDGLDEISDDGSRRIFADHLRAFVKVHPEVALVVTSREAGFRAVAGTITNVCTEARLASFDQQDVQRLCVNWHLEVVGNTEKVRADARELAAAIWANDRIRSLVTNPLLLTTLLVVKRWVGQLPQRRVTLYGKAVEVLLTTWNVEGHAPISDEEALPQLSYLACAMMEHGVQRISRGHLVTYLKAARQELENELFGTKLTPAEFIERIELRSSLLIQVGHEVFEEELQPVYEFQHLTFQEYLAARGYVQGHRPGSHDGRKIVDLLEPHFQEAKWREVIALAVVLAKREASEIVERLTVVAEQAWSASNRLSDDESASIETLISCLLDEPPIHPAAATAAFRLIVQTPAPYLGLNLPLNFARGRFSTLVFEAALQQFLTLDGLYSYPPDYLVACTIVAEGYPWSESSAPAAMQSLLHRAGSLTPRDQIPAILTASDVIRDFVDIPWARDSAATRNFAAATGSACLKLLPQISRPLLVAVGWCLGHIGRHELWKTTVDVRQMESIVLLMKRFRNQPPGGQMCYAFSGLPLLEPDAFSISREEWVAPFIREMVAIAEQKDSGGDSILQAMTILAWYSDKVWTKKELIVQIKRAFSDKKSALATAMLLSLGSEQV